MNKQDRDEQNQALVIAQRYDFGRGLVYLYERLGLYPMALQYFMDTKDHENIKRICEENGKKDPNLWLQVGFFLNVIFISLNC